MLNNANQLEWSILVEVSAQAKLKELISMIKNGDKNEVNSTGSSPRPIHPVQSRPLSIHRRYSRIMDKFSDFRIDGSALTLSEISARPSSNSRSL